MLRTIRCIAARSLSSIVAGVSRQSRDRDYIPRSIEAIQLK